MRNKLLILLGCLVIPIGIYTQPRPTRLVLTEWPDLLIIGFVSLGFVFLALTRLPAEAAPAKVLIILALVFLAIDLPLRLLSFWFGFQSSVTDWPFFLAIEIGFLLAGTVVLAKSKLQK